MSQIWASPISIIWGETSRGGETDRDILVEVDPFVMIACKAAVEACHICAKALVASEVPLRRQRNLLLCHFLHSTQHHRCHFGRACVENTAYRLASTR